MSAENYSSLPSFSDLITQYCEPSKSRGKFICPVCGGDDLSVSKHGKWNCFSDPSPEHRQAVCRRLNARLREDSPEAFGGDERWTEKRYQKSLQWRQLMSRVEELNYLLWNSVDPDFGITEEMFWKEFIGYAVRIGIEPSRAITAAEERVHKKCPSPSFARD